MVVSQLAVLIVKVALHSEYYQLVRSTRVAHPSREVLCNTAEALTALTKFFYFAYSYRCCNRRLPVCMPTNLISELMREKEFYYKSVFVCCIIFTRPVFSFEKGLLNHILPKLPAPLTASPLFIL